MIHKSNMDAHTIAFNEGEEVRHNGRRFWSLNGKIYFTLGFLGFYLYCDSKQEMFRISDGWEGIGQWDLDEYIKLHNRVQILESLC
jgi:hypothetical protein